jgi:hypothetical protein
MVNGPGVNLRRNYHHIPTHRISIHTLAFLLLWLLMATSLSAGPRFQAATSYAAGSSPAAVALGDFNNDGLIDIVVVNNAGTGTNNINVLLGNGDGSFQTARSTNAPATLVAVAAADFNKDGKLDVVVLDQASRTVTVMLGNGDGTFASSGTTCSTGAKPVAMATADLNRDGNLDVVTVNYDDNSVTVCLGNGAGGFTAGHSYAASTSAANHPDGIAIAEVTGDGKLDLVISVWENAYSIVQGNGDGSFQAPLTNIIYDVPNPRAVAAGDLNGDGITDLVFSTGQTTVLLGNGNGTFRTPVNYPGGAGPVSMVDLDGDGALDLVMGNTLQSSISVLKNTGNGSFAPPVVYAADNQAVAIAVGDVNRDGKADVIVVNNPAAPPPSLGSVSVLLGNGDTTLAAAMSYQLSRTAWGSANSVATADFNGDGRPDAAALMNGNSTFTIFLGDASNLFQAGTNYDSGFSQGTNVGDGTGPATDLAAGDVNHDGKCDLVIIGYKGIRVLLGKGDGSFEPPTLIPLPAGFNHRIALADLDGDGNLDIVFTQSVSGSDIGILYGDGTGNFSAPTQISVGYLPTDIVVADFNHDQKLDIATGNAGSITVSVLLSLGNRGFAPAQSYNLSSLGNGTDSVTLAAVDVDGDQIPDLVAVNGGNGAAGNISILRNDGTGSLTLLHQYTTGTTLQRITAADFDGNRTNDLAVSNWQGQVFVFSGNGNGSFAPAVPYVAGPGAIGMVAAPFSNAGAFDLAVVTSNASALALLLNAGGTRYDYGSSPNPSALGLPVTVIAAFHPALKWAGTPTGSVTLQDGLTPIATATLDQNGAATFTTSNLAFGNHQLRAVYSGDSNFVPRTLTLGQTVLHGTSIALQASTTTPVVGSSVTLTATVTSALLPIPTGSVSFQLDGSTMLGSGTLDGKGESSLTTTALPGGTHNVTAVYGGDSSSLPSSSSVSVATADFTGTPSAASVSVRAGQPANLTLNISPMAGFTGQVSFACSGLPLYASCTFSPTTITLSGTGATSTQLTINTATTNAAVQQPSRGRHEYYLAFAIACSGFAGLVVTGGNRRRKWGWSVLLAILFSLALMTACGGSGGGGGSPQPTIHTSPVGTSVVTIAMTAMMNGTTVSHTISLSLTVTP